MRIKSNKKNTVLRPIGWLTLLLIALIALAWLSTKIGNLSNTSLTASKTISEAAYNSKAQKKTFQEIIELYKDQTILLSAKDEASKNFSDQYRSLVQKMGGEQLATLA